MLHWNRLNFKGLKFDWIVAPPITRSLFLRNKWSRFFASWSKGNYLDGLRAVVFLREVSRLMCEAGQPPRQGAPIPNKCSESLTLNKFRISARVEIYTVGLPVDSSLEGLRVWVNRKQNKSSVCKGSVIMRRSTELLRMQRFLSTRVPKCSQLIRGVGLLWANKTNPPGKEERLYGAAEIGASRFLPSISLPTLDK